MWCGSVDGSTRVRQQVCKQTRRGRCWSCCLPSWGFAEGTEYVPWRNICIPIISTETAIFTDRPVFLLWCGLQILAVSEESCGPLSRVGGLAEHAPILSIMHAKAHSWMCEVIMTIICTTHYDCLSSAPTFCFPTDNIHVNVLQLKWGGGTQSRRSWNYNRGGGWTG